MLRTVYNNRKLILLSVGLLFLVESDLIRTIRVKKNLRNLQKHPIIQEIPKIPIVKETLGESPLEFVAFEELSSIIKDSKKRNKRKRIRKTIKSIISVIGITYNYIDQVTKSRNRFKIPWL